MSFQMQKQKLRSENLPLNRPSSKINTPYSILIEENKRVSCGEILGLKLIAACKKLMKNNKLVPSNKSEFTINPNRVIYR